MSQSEWGKAYHCLTSICNSPLSICQSVRLETNQLEVVTGLVFMRMPVFLLFLGQ